MASLIEELISVIESEDKIYKELLPIAESKTRIIINNDLQALQDITGQEQLMIEQINVLERKRQEVIVNIGTVISRNPASLDMKSIIKILEKQPAEQKKLAVLHDSLKTSLNQLSKLNERNKSLIEQSLEMIEFNMNLMQSTRMAPGTNNYNKSAASSWNAQAERTRMFDTKQ